MTRTIAERGTFKSTFRRLRQRSFTCPIADHAPLSYVFDLPDFPVKVV